MQRSKTRVRSLKVTAQIGIPEIGLHLAKTKDGEIWVRRLKDNGRSRWEPYDIDLLSLALEGRTREIEAYQKLREA